MIPQLAKGHQVCFPAVQAREGLDGLDRERTFGEPLAYRPVRALKTLHPSLVTLPPAVRERRAPDVGMLGEAERGTPSYVSGDVLGPIELNDAEIRERMSGNLCRCGAYVNVVAAIRRVACVESAS